MKIVFLGDSITDAGKNCSGGSTIAIGQGYPLIVDAMLSSSFPGKYEFHNAGISGSRVVDLYARVKSDAWNSTPDVISILVGVNDVWHEYMEHHGGVDAKRYEAVYRMLLHDTIERLPNVKLMLLEPFALKASATAEIWDSFKPEVQLRADAVKRLASEFNATFIPLQKKLCEVCTLQPAPYWLADGVHPTPAGHQLIANAWLNAFRKIDV